VQPVTVVLRHNETLELNLVEYVGAITPAQLKGIAAFGAQNPTFLMCDAFNLVHADADFNAVDFGVLDALFAGYSKLYQPLNFQIYRRASWVCRSEAARPHIDYWVGRPDMRETMSSAVRQFDTFDEAGDWLLLSAAELAVVERGEGFVDLAVIEDAPSAARVAAR
jgi:hypothetical protein